MYSKKYQLLVYSLIIVICFKSGSIFKNYIQDYMPEQGENPYIAPTYNSMPLTCSDIYHIKFSSLKNNVSNIVFLSDGSFTVGSKLGVPKIYSDGITKGRYGIITSEAIEVGQNFESIIAKIDKIDSSSGEAVVNFRATDNLGNYTEWLGFDGHQGDKITFYPKRQYKFLECSVSIITNDTTSAPIIKSISVRPCN